ncbi:Kinase domain-containing protein [Aphelenchoides besseyi]|nr:Kinase domain-containing protein [Aphelenchoides besseyi]KAI6199583.1 Kinase domain-containing protein [Aphelenchoides besseyi]
MYSYLLSNNEQVRTLDVNQLQSACYYSDSIYCLQDGELFKYDKDGGSKSEIPTNFHIQTVSSQFGFMFAISTVGRLYVFDGQTFLLLNVVATGRRNASCTHGVQESPRSLDVIQVATTEQSTLLVDKSGQLWSFQNQLIELSPNQKISATFIELNKCKYWIRQLSAGKRHCIALVDFANTNQNSNDDDTYQTISTCNKCLEDTNLRLSTLMKTADETFAESMSDGITQELKDEVPSSPNLTFDHTAETSESGFGRFFPRIRTPFFKSSTPLTRSSNNSSSRWYAVPAKQRNSIELTTWTPPSKPLNSAGSVSFSFVSLSNLASSSGSSAITNEDEQLESIFESSFTNGLHSFVSEQNANIYCEIWAWGANDFGQLGIGNTVPTRTAKRVKVPHSPFIKVVTGFNHSLVLLATGEVYGFGDNANGQMKIDSSYIAEPTLIKFGSKTCVLDIAAYGNMSIITMTSEENSNIVACRFSKETALSNTTRLDYLEQFGWPLRIDLMANGSSLLVNYLPLADTKDVKVSEQLSIFSKLLRTTRFVVQLAQLAYGIKEKTQRESLNVLSAALFQWSVTLSQMAEKMINNLYVSWKPYDFQLSSIVKTFFKYHYSESIKKQVENLSLEHEAESSKEFKRIRSLFSVPQRQFFLLTTVLNRILTENRPATFWRRLENDVNRAEKWAKLTSKNLKTYPRESTDSLLAGFVEEPECRINRISPSSLVIRQFLGKSHTLLLVWTRSIDVIQKSTVTKLGYQLLRIQRDNDKNPNFLNLADPETSFEIEFSSTESASSFLELINRAWSYWRTRANFANSPIDFVPQTPVFESRVRYGRFRFSPLHSRFANCEYDGQWLDLQPHGRGFIKYPDGRQYRGRFIRGEIDGLGEMTMKSDGSSSIDISTSQSASLVNSIFYSHLKDVTDSCVWLKGRFKSGKLNGLGTAMFLNGDTYEGYWANGLMNGHGVYRSKDDHNVYVGGWKDGAKHGYGVLSSNRERYMGEWSDNKQNGQGAIITIDGVYHEGVFENTKFINGRVVFETITSIYDPNSIVTYEGKFDGLGVASGKGALYLNRRDSIVGTMHGRILSDELSITNATYKHDFTETNEEQDFIMTGGPIRGSWMVDEKHKWIELFVHFLEDLKVSPSDFFEVINSKETVSFELAERTWNHLAASISKIKQQKKVSFDDRLERVPNYKADFSPSYYASVVEYWDLCAVNEHHPLHRLIRGVVELFCSSYCSVGTHVSMYDAAVLELRELLARCYAVARILFVNLPPVSEMFTLVPNSPDFHHDDASDNSTDTAETLSIASLEELSNRPSTSNSSPVRAKVRSNFSSTGSTNSSTAVLGTPCCDFLINVLFRDLYADLFTVYSERCQAADKRYWDRVLQLNSHTDAQLLRYFDVKGDLWPADFENTRELDTFTVRISARNKFYNNAVTQFQRISGVFNPTDKLAILVETFSEITSCTAKFANVGEHYSMNLDDLFGPFLYVVARSQVQHLGAEIRYMSDFCRHVDSSSELAYMFTILETGYVQICKEASKIHP